MIAEGARLRLLLAALARSMEAHAGNAGRPGVAIRMHFQLR